MPRDKLDPSKCCFRSPVNPRACHALTQRFLPGVIHDCVQPVCNGQYCAVHKLCPNGHLDEVICLQVDGGRGFIQDQDPGFAQESSGQAHELPLANTASTDSLYCPQLPTAHSHSCSAGHSSGYPKNPEIFCKLPGLSAP